MTSLELFNHRYKKGQKFSWLEMLDFAEAYAAQKESEAVIRVCICPRCALVFSPDLNKKEGGAK
jgi:hypothetical protein